MGMKFESVDIERLVTRYGRMYVPALDSVIGRSLRLYGEWAEHEISCISRCIHGPGTIIDVGGNLGTHAIALASRHPDCQVFSFEPQPFLFSIMSASVVFNGFGNINLLNFGCGQSAEIRTVDVDYDSVDWNTGAVSFSGDSLNKVGGLPLSFVRLDQVHFPMPVGFIKIDVEGMELDVLLGASRILETDRPCVLFEVLSTGCAEDCRRFLAGLGYRCYWLGFRAFNPDNYNGVAENIWGHGELCALAVPSEISRPAFIPESFEISDGDIAKTVGEIRTLFEIPL
jgi:FkbM family methyltransferase